MVGRLAHAQTGALVDDLAYPSRELRVHIDAGAHRVAAQRDFLELLAGLVQAAHGAFHLAGVALELLAQSNRRRVLEMRATGLDDRPELFAFLLQHLAQALDGRDQDLVQFRQRCQVHRRRDDVVGRLLAVDIVVRVNELRAELAAEQLAGSVGDDFVGIGIGGCA